MKNNKYIPSKKTLLEETEESPSNYRISHILINQTIENRNELYKNKTIRNIHHIENTKEQHLTLIGFTSMANNLTIPVKYNPKNKTWLTNKKLIPTTEKR